MHNPGNIRRRQVEGVATGEQRQHPPSVPSSTSLEDRNNEVGDDRQVPSSWSRRFQGKMATVEEETTAAESKRRRLIYGTQRSRYYPSASTAPPEDAPDATHRIGASTSRFVEASSSGASSSGENRAVQARRAMQLQPAGLQSSRLSRQFGKGVGSVLNMIAARTSMPANPLKSCQHDPKYSTSDSGMLGRWVGWKRSQCNALQPRNQEETRSRHACSKGKGEEKKHDSGVRLWTWWDNLKRAPGLIPRLGACILAVAMLWGTTLSVAGTYAVEVLQRTSRTHFGMSKSNRELRAVSS